MGQAFRIAARAMRQLGAELITSDEMALNELIKNAFDANSPRVTVAISAPADAGALALLEEQLDDDEEKVSKGVAIERAEKAISPDMTVAQRAQVLSLFKENASSRKELRAFLERFRSENYWLQISDTGDGMSADDLSERFLVVGTPNKFLAKKDLSASDRPVLGDKGIGRLSMMRLGNLARVESKVADADRWHGIEFVWSKFDDPALYLGDISFEVERGERDEASRKGTRITIRELLGHWSFGKVQSFLDKYIRRLQDPFAEVKRPYPIDIVLNGHRLPISPIPKWMTDCAQFRADITFNPNVKTTSEPVLRRSLAWRDRGSPEIRTWSLDDLARLADVPVETCRRLGAFKGACLWFNRAMLVTPGVDRSRKQITDELNLWCGGFAIYRDGFRVGQTGGMDDDWLEWDGRALRTKGFMLNRYQTVGSISITSQGNPYLVDAANRERLVGCPEQQLLVEILGSILVQDFRGHIDATKQAQLKSEIAEESTEESLKKSEAMLRRTIANVDEIGQVLPRSEQPKVDDIRQSLQGQIEYVKTIKSALLLARETRVELLELANIGLVVEIVIHELSRLTEKTGELLADLQEKRSTSDVVDVIDNLQVQIRATNKRIRSVDVMSPAGRNRKENYDAVAQTQTIVSGFKARFRRHDIECQVTLDGRDPAGRRLEVHMVRGLIAQAMENLLTNSVYWLQQGLKAGESARQIQIEIDTKSRTISVTDNGPGVDPAYAKEIFKPYYSTRKRGKGLGLYIASELVEYHGGKLYLDSASDEDGRLRTFVLELPREER